MHFRKSFSLLYVSAKKRSRYIRNNIGTQSTRQSVSGFCYADTSVINGKCIKCRITCGGNNACRLSDKRIG